MHGDNILMTELASNFRFVLKSCICIWLVGKRSVEHFDRDNLVHQNMPTAINNAHATTSDGRKDFIPFIELGADK